MRVYVFGRHTVMEKEIGRLSKASVFVWLVVGVAAGGDHSMVLMQNNSVWAAGCNKYGQLGDVWRSTGWAC